MSSRDRARRARALAMVCTATGMAAMIVAPLARSAPQTAADPGESAVATLARSNTTSGQQAEPTVGGDAPPAPRGRWIGGDGETRAVVYPPRSASPSGPTVVLLHGLCGHPESACAPFVEASTAHGWLVCPRGEDPCGGGSRWRLRPDEDGRVVEASVSALASDPHASVDKAASRVLVGFSLGGIAAVRVAQSASSGSGPYKGLVVIASQVHPDATLLERAGVRRVVLAAGDFDMTSAPLQADARAMNRAGLPTRYVSLGSFGHGYPADMEERMREPMAWVTGEEAVGER